MTRKQIIEHRKKHAKFMQESAQSIERGSIGLKTVTALGILTPSERKIIDKAEKMALKAANVSRRVANRMGQMA